MKEESGLLLMHQGSFVLGSRIRHLVATSLVYLIVPNLPIWIFEKKMALTTHGYFNIECLLVGALSTYVPRSVTLFLLLIEICASFVYLVCYTYQFSLRSLIDSAQYLSLLPVGKVSLILAAFVVASASSAVLAFLYPRRQQHRSLGVPVALVSVAFLLVATDTYNGRNPALSRDHASAIPRLSLSPFVTLAGRGVMWKSVERSATYAKAENMDSASARGIGFLGQRPVTATPNIVLIVVESWGLFEDPRLADSLTAVYQAPEILANYRVSHGTAPFDGLTVPGEARELCHSRVGFGILKMMPGQESGCLPARLHANGYQNIAVHGYVGGMFQRQSWYRTIGFDEAWFSPDLDRAGLAHCGGAFPGICDGAIADWIGRALLSDTADQPKFIYWLTLNSHLPVPEVRDSPQGGGQCSSDAELASSQSLCSWFQLISDVHGSVQHLALEAHNRPTVFILVGDHAPPFSDSHLRGLFSSEEVPYVILTPNGRGAGAGPAYHEGGS